MPETAGKAENQSPREATIAQGYTEYINEDIDITFRYPKTWGEVGLKNNEGSDEEGFYKSIVFTKQDSVTAAVQSKDYHGFGLGANGFPPYGFTNYKNYADQLKDLEEGAVIVDQGGAHTLVYYEVSALNIAYFLLAVEVTTDRQDSVEFVYLLNTMAAGFAVDKQSAMEIMSGLARAQKP